ncbi:MAG: glycosyltransferase [Chloroflexi bacterium]|nr:glycosyltransferase [Chloroflexota bacterium]
MSEPFLCVVIPAFNEEKLIGDAIAQLSDHLSTKTYSWEIIVSDDGSSDRTAEIVTDAAERDNRVRLVQIPHRGKGAAMQAGMLASNAAWRFMCDADLSMPADQIDRFFVNDEPAYDIGVGSREAPGSRRINEPWRRHFIGRIYNYAARMFAVRGLDDTQCGFKMYRGALADSIFGGQTLPGFGFDVEVLFLAQKQDANMEEIAIDWYYRQESKVSLIGGALGFIDIFRVRLNNSRGVYRDTASK